MFLFREYAENQILLLDANEILLKHSHFFTLLLYSVIILTVL